MKPDKKNLYELLQLAETASTEAVREAHDRRLAELQAQRNPHNGADIDFQIQTIKVALTTLSSPSSRLAYDDRLAQERSSARAVTARLHSHQPPPTWDRELPPEAQAILLRAQGKGDKPTDGETAAPAWFGIFSTAKSAVTRALLFIGLLAVLGTLLQVMFFRSQIANTSPSDARTTAAEKAVLQEYFQTYGVRPASRADMDILEQERRQKEQARYQAERQQEQAARAQKQFEEETRRRADQVSASLRRAEEEALNKALNQR